MDITEIEEELDIYVNVTIKMLENSEIRMYEF